MDYYDSGTIDRATGTYIDRFGYPVVERGTPVFGFPADTNPTETERSIQTLRTNRIETIDGTSLEMPPISLTSVTTPLVVGNPDLELRTISDGGTLIFRNDTDSGALAFSFGASSADIKAINGVGPNCSLTLNSKGASSIFLSTETQTGYLEVDPHNAGCGLYARNGTGNADMYIASQGTGNTIIFKPSASGQLQVQPENGGLTMRALDSLADSSIRIEPKNKGQCRVPNWGFQLYTWSATQAIPATTNTKIIFLQEAYTTFPSGFITYSGTNTYTNTSGATCTLLVTASIRGNFDSTIGSPELWINKNNGTGSIFLGKTIYPVGTTSTFAMTTTAIVRLDAGEDFSIWAHMSQAATIGNNTGAAEPHKVTVLDVRYMP